MSVIMCLIAILDIDACRMWIAHSWPLDAVDMSNSIHDHYLVDMWLAILALDVSRNVIAILDHYDVSSN